MVVKQEKVYFEKEEINALHGLDDNMVGEVIFKNPMRKDIRNALKIISWSETMWDINLIEKYQFFSHNLNTQASVCLFFMKNKFMPMSHDSTISMDKAELLYYITEEILVNVYEIIYEPIHACVRHPRNARPFHI